MKKKYVAVSFIIAALIICIDFKFNFIRNYLGTGSMKTWKQPDVTLIGRVKLADGICRLGIDIAETLKGKAKIGVIAPKKDLEGLSDYQKSVFKRDNKTLGKVVILTDALFYQKNDPVLPNFYKIIKGPSPSNQIRYCYSMLESSAIPEKWVEIINYSYDAVLVPDKYLVNVYKASGVNKPIFEIPFPIILDEFLGSRLKENRNDVFTFGCTSSCIARKNLLKLVQAFYSVFKNRNDVCLKINSRYAHEKIEAELIEFLNKHQPSNIQYTRFELDNPNYLKFMQSLDCFITLSRGEGFSIQPRQALALGIPTIVTDNTSQSTIARNGIVRSIKALNEIPAYYFFSNLPIGSEYDCDLTDATNAMLDVFNNYDFFLKKAQEARRWAAQYSAESLKNLYLTVVKPNKVELGDHNEIKESLIITKDSNLINKYVNNVLD